MNISNSAENTGISMYFFLVLASLKSTIQGTKSRKRKVAPQHVSNYAIKQFWSVTQRQETTNEPNTSKDTAHDQSRCPRSFGASEKSALSESWYSSTAQRHKTWNIDTDRTPMACCGVDGKATSWHCNLFAYWASVSTLVLNICNFKKHLV